MKTFKQPIFLFIFFGMMTILCSCSMFRMAGNPNNAASFQSYPNGIADLHLDLKPNMKFEYEMNILPEMGTTDTIGELFTFKGRWGNNEEQYMIRFRRRNKPDLYALFSPGYEPQTNVVVMDDRTIRFPLEDSEVVIWGIKCFKLKEE